MTSTVSPKKATKLLRWLILLSLLLHIPIYLHMNGLLDLNVLHYIDLTIRKEEDSQSRKILRPPPLVKNKGKPDTTRTNLMTPVRIPENSQLLKAGDGPVRAALSNSGTVPFPSVGDMGGGGSAVGDSSLTEIGSSVGLSSTGVGGEGRLMTKEEYIEMVRLKLDRNHRFPPEAALRKKGGVVTVQFVIDFDGTIRDLKIAVPSQTEALNRRALQTVRESAPFLKLPPHIFTEPFLFTADIRYSVF